MECQYCKGGCKKDGKQKDGTQTKFNDTLKKSNDGVKSIAAKAVESGSRRVINTRRK